MTGHIAGAGEFERSTAPAANRERAAWLSALPQWLILLLVAVAARAVTFGDPLVHVDEQFYVVTAQRLLHGALPYVDIWDRKPIGLFLIYAPAAALGVRWGIFAYQAMALASVVATALLIAQIARRVGWAAGASVAALLYILMLNLADGQGGQAPVFYNLLTAAAVALILPRADDLLGDRRRIARNLLAMLLIGLAMQVKYPVVFEGLFLGLWLLHREYRLGATAVQLVLCAIGYAGMAALPTMAAGAVYAALGHFDAWLYANFASVLNRRSDPPLELFGGFCEVTLALAPALIVSGFGWRSLRRKGRPPADAALLFGWLLSAIAGLVLFGSWFNHYALPVMLPGCLCSAAWFAHSKFGRRRVAPALLALVLIVGEAMTASAAYHRGSHAQLQTLADAVGRGPGCLYVHSGDSMLYGYTGRCAASAWLFPSHLSRSRENGAVGVDQLAEVDRIFARRPAIVVMRPPYRGERMAVRARVMAHMDQLGYRVRGEYRLGTVPITVYAAPWAVTETPPAP